MGRQISLRANHYGNAHNTRAQFTQASACLPRSRSCKRLAFGVGLPCRTRDPLLPSVPKLTAAISAQCQAQVLTGVAGKGKMGKDRESGATIACAVFNGHTFHINSAYYHFLSTRTDTPAPTAVVLTYAVAQHHTSVRNSQSVCLPQERTRSQLETNNMPLPTYSRAEVAVGVTAV